MKRSLCLIIKTAVIIIFLTSISKAGQTGKLAGVITNSETGEPVIGANVMVQGTHLGAAADIEGYYYINNIPPGTYTVTVSAVGFSKTIIKEVVIKIDLTTDLNVELVPESIKLGEDVVVTAKRPLITNDLTSTKATVSSKDIEMMPVDNVAEVVNLQAGVVDGHFRGGRANEVAYLVDGIPVTDVFSGSNAVEVENSAIRELEVISGTFNAEYGQALSGVINIVTKEGGEKFEGSVTTYAGTYLSNNSELYPNLDKLNVDGVRDIQVSLSGPTPISNLTYFVNGRYFRNDGAYYGKRVYVPSDSDPYGPSGDEEYVRMNYDNRNTFNGKLTFSKPNYKVSYSFLYSGSENKYYDHAFRWTPDGIMTHYSNDMVHNLQFTFYPTQSTFSTLKFASSRYDFEGYLYEDPYDPRYVDPYQGIPTSSYTFRHGGQHSDRYNRFTHTYTGQWHIESQVTKEHKVKFGVETQIHELKNHWRTIVNLTEGQVDENGNPIFTLGYRQPGTADNQAYHKYPYQFVGFIQDKMEYDIMIINAGLRLDYFNPNSTMPADLRNPSRINPNPNFPGAGESVEVDSKYQVGPRLGVSFPISDKGAIYFSYGHFFQIPNFENLYRNNNYIIDQGQSLSSITGNPDLDAQKTVKYELGVQQVLFPNISLDATVYYSDIRNLLGMEIINTYEGFKYARFINRDYGNVKGMILTLEKRFSHFFSAKIDYTYQIAEGNSSDPFAVYNDNQSDPPVESEKKVVPLDWDQRSTINVSATVGIPGNWTVGIIAQYGSGMPYTEDIQISNGVRFENGGRKPATFNVDLKADKFFDLYGLDLHAYLLVYNVFDIKNEQGVYATTGRATYDLNAKYAGEINGLNTIEQYINNPAMYSAPRQIRLGLSLNF